MSNVSNTVTPLPPKTCNYTDLKDYLLYARKVNDLFSYEVNKIREPEIECSRVWKQLENASNERKKLINNCLVETENLLNNNNNPVTNTILKRQLEQRLNMLRLEEDVENVMMDAAQKVFYKVCKVDYNHHDTIY